MITKLTLYLIIIAISSYLLGGVNGAIITSLNFFKKDVRKFGSGNAGLTNFARTFGTSGALLVIAVDVLKAVIAVLFGGWLLGLLGLPEIGRLFAGFCAMLGHIYPIYYHFKGGKATLCGGVVVWMIDWRVGLFCWAVFIIVVIFTRYVSLGSIIGSALLPITLIMFGYNGLEIILGLLCTLLICFAHRENVGRLIRGQESKLSIGSHNRK